MTEIRVPKNIKKSDLNKHLEDLHNKRVGMLKDKYRPQLQEISNDIHFYLKRELEEAEKTRLLMQEVDWKFLYDLISEYDYHKLGLTTFNLSTPILQHARKRLDYFITNMTTLDWDDESIEKRPELVQMTDSFNSVMSSYYEERDESRRLRKELKGAIASEKRAQKGFKILAELGLDMSKFQPSAAELPAVIQTSVDISIFNELADE